MKYKKAQHEMFGFVLIVVIVVIVGMFMLMFYLKKPVETQSRSVESFLESSMLYTTECSVRAPGYDNLKDLIKDAYKGRKCANGKMASEMLNETVFELTRMWITKEGKKAYSFNIEHAGQQILSLKEGNWNNCTSKMGAEHLFPHLPGNMIVRMDVCG